LKTKKEVIIKDLIILTRNPLYNKISAIFNSKIESATTKQIILEKWIVDYEIYIIRDLIEKMR
jgi:hypothetical protein